MAIVLKNTGERDMLKVLTGNAAAPPSPVRLRLFQNNAAPAAGNPLIGDFTECTIAGYAAQTIIAANWVYAVAAFNGTADYGTLTFNLTAAGTLYGYYLTEAVAANVIAYEFFAGAPITVPAGGLSVAVTLHLVLGPCP